MQLNFFPLHFNTRIAFNYYYGLNVKLIEYSFYVKGKFISDTQFQIEGNYAAKEVKEFVISFQLQ